MNELRCLSGGGKLVRVWGRRIAVGALVFAVTALGPIQHTLIPVALAPPAPHPAVLITARQHEPLLLRHSFYGTRPSSLPTS